MTGELNPKSEPYLKKTDAFLEALEADPEFHAWITKDIYDKKHQEYADRLQSLEVELSEHRNADYEYQTTVATLINVARRARQIFDGCSEPMQKRAFLKFLLQNPSVKEKSYISL